MGSSVTEPHCVFIYSALVSESVTLILFTDFWRQGEIQGIVRLPSRLMAHSDRWMALGVIFIYPD
jgi:hypothetical protein